MPAPNDDFLVRMLEMQTGANGLRELKTNILPVPCMTSNPAIRFLGHAAQLNSLLKSIIEKGEETYRLENQDVPSDTALHS